MPNSLSQYFEEERNRVIEECSLCGQCIRECPIIEHTDLKDHSPMEVQRKVIDFLTNGEKNDDVYIKAFACMECYKCVKKHCPKGLNPLLINEIIKWQYKLKGHAPIPYTDPKDQYAKQRVLASIQVSAEDYKRIFMPTNKKSARYVFFPGCNVYLQPEKVLEALDIMDIIGEDYAFVPGLDFCCGNVYLEAGVVEKGYNASQELIAKLSSYNPETVIFWCPTCQCRFDMTVSKVSEMPFNIISYPQFLTANVDKLPFNKNIDKTVTLHEACKIAYMGLDITSVREVLHKIPGVDLIEMSRHGENTACCGSSAMDFFENSMAVIRDERLQEAEETGADILVDICQTCHNIFAKEELKHTFEITNYVSLIAEALGIEREDKYKKYKQWGSLKRILEDAQEYIAQSEYPRDTIIEVLKNSIASEESHE
ncbi:MAG: (Fe-S)-binding protein [Desulfosporosinus sp.]|nr:(Fe-S)-binding protein [Desulfosporosinus sp.]